MMLLRSAWVALGAGVVCCSAGCSAGGSDVIGAAGGAGSETGGSGGTGVLGGDGGSAASSGSLTCNPGAWACSGNVHYLCGADGATHEQENQCPDACDPTLGCVACVPDTRRCEGDVSMVCTSAGAGWVAARDCAEWGSACAASGYCDDVCSRPTAGSSSWRRRRSA